MKNNKTGLLISALLICFCSAAGVYGANIDNISPEPALQEENIKANKATYEKAVEAINNKDFEAAIVYLSAYINSKSKKYEAYKLRGDAYYALRQYALAAKDYQSAIDIKSSEDKFMTNTKYVSAVILGADKNEQLQNPELGDLYGRLMYAQKALNDINYETSYNLAVKYNSHIYLPQPKKEEIVQINCPQKYGKVLNPQGIDGYIYGAVDDIEKEDYTSAVFKSQYVISNYPKYYLGYYLNGVALNGLEKDDDAAIAFKKALELNPDDFESMASLGNIYFDKSQVTFLPEDAQKSIEYFKSALKYNNSNYLYHFYIGMDELQLGNINDSISEFNNAIKIKPNDYNSLYYKLIAQYIKGDYPKVVSGTTKLLYKHVSNFNSVLYLRALAEFKLKDYDKASEDLDSIFGNIEDIYNADVKVVSEKEKCLESYVYYLKAKIAQLEGGGAKSDLAKAYKNPIISSLAKAQDAINPYEQMLSQDKISLDDFNKFNSFYRTGLPKLLQAGVVITEQDIDNQYDYIRTTFDDMGLAFVYTNPDYKLTTIKDYPYKKYYSKVSSDNAVMSSAPENNIKPTEGAKENGEQTTLAWDTSNNPAAAPKPEKVLKETTPQEEMLASDYETSLAQMLATSSFGMLGPVSPEKTKTIVNAPEVVKKEPVVIDETAASNALSGEPSVFANKSSSVNKENTQNVKKIMEEESKIEEAAAQAKEPIKDITEKTYTINEKHAPVDPKIIGAQSPKEPEISKTDEIVVLDNSGKTLFPKKTEQDTSVKSLSKPEVQNDKQPQNIEVNEVKEQNIEEKAALAEQTTEQKEDKQVTKPETEVTIEEPAEEKTENTAQNVSSEVPVVNVPEVITPEVPVKQKISEKTNEDVKKPELRAKSEENNSQETSEKTISSDEQKVQTEKSAVETTAISDIDKEKQEIEKIKAAEEEKARREEIKAQKIKQKEDARIQKEQEKALKQAEKEKLKAEKVQAKALKKAEKEKMKQEKIQAKAAAKEEKERQEIERAAQKELEKAQKAQEIADKAINEDKKEKSTLKIKFSDKKKPQENEPKEVKRTVIKQLKPIPKPEAAE